MFAGFIANNRCLAHTERWLRSSPRRASGSVWHVLFGIVIEIDKQARTPTAHYDAVRNASGRKGDRMKRTRGPFVTGSSPSR
jgi:hypothetical protein